MKKVKYINVYYQKNGYPEFIEHEGMTVSEVITELQKIKSLGYGDSILYDCDYCPIEKVNVKDSVFMDGLVDVTIPIIE